MNIGGRKEKKEWQTRSATDEGMDAVATQEWTRMLRRSMTKGGIRVSTTPGEDGSAIDNEITGTNQPATDGGQNTEDEEGFGQWSSCWP